MERTTHYAVHDRRSGELVVRHSVTVMAGARSVSPELVQKRVLKCAAQACGRPSASLRVARRANPAAAAPRANGERPVEAADRIETDPRVLP